LVINYLIINYIINDIIYYHYIIN